MTPTQIDPTPPPTRKLAVVGRLHGRTRRPELALRCAWCGRFFSLIDRLRALLGADISHGLCAACETSHSDPPKVEP